MAEITRIGCAMALLALTLAGCQSAPPGGMRELYTEGTAGEELKLQPLPLEADAHTAYQVYRPLGGAAIAEVDSMVATGYALWFPHEKAITSTGAVCFLSHAAFVDGLDVIHHFKLFLLNRLDHALRLPVELLNISPALELLAVVNADAERVQQLWDVAPGENRVLHVFYRTRGVDRVLTFAWELQGPPGPEGSPPTVGPWLFQVELGRKYVCQEVPLSELERRVVLGEEFPPAREPDAPWAEPFLTPVPGAQPDVGGDAGGDGSSGG